MVLLRVGLAAVALIAAVTQVAAQPEAVRSAAELVAEGEQLAQQKDYAAALRAFRAAAQIEPSAHHECYIALTYRKMKRYPEARLHLDRAGARADDSGPRWCVSRLAADLRRVLRQGSFAEVEVTTQPAGATVTISSLADGEPFTAPSTVWLAFGAHAVTVSHPGYASQDVSITIRSKAAAPLNVVLATSASQREAPLALQPTPPVRSASPARSGDDRGGRSPWAWLALSVGALGVATGGVFHVKALNSKKDAEELTEGAAFDARLATFERQRLFAIGGYATGAVVAGVGLYLLLRQQPAKRSERRVALDCSSGALVVRLFGDF